MVAGDGGGILTFTFCSARCPFWVEPVQKENGARTKVYCPFWVAAGGGVGSRLDLLKGISYINYNNGGNMNRKNRRTNPFSGKSEMLTNDEAILYDQIKTAEMNEEWETLQAGLDKFSRLNPSAYMTLLD